MHNRGLVKLIILIIIGTIVLGYFGINIRSVIESDIVQDNLGYLWNGTKTIWQDYLSKPADFVWGIFYNYIWLAFIENMDRIRHGEGTLPQELVPTFE
ncbi:MAG: hypothetical protein ABII97_03270 [Patescibacteria group bacterium]